MKTTDYIYDSEVYIRLSNGNIMFLQWGSEPAPDSEGTVDYTIFNIEKEEIDGGQLDFSPIDKYQYIQDAIKDTLEFAYLGDEVPDYEILDDYGIY